MFFNVLLFCLCYDDVDMDFTNDSSDQLNVRRNKVVAKIIPIATLHHYRSVWTIKARISAKTHLRQFTMQEEMKKFLVLIWLILMVGK